MLVVVAVNAARRIKPVAIVVIIVISVFGLSASIVHNSFTRNCLQEGQRAAACGVGLLERIKNLPEDEKGTQQAMVAFSVSAIASAPKAQRRELEEALDLVYLQIDEASADCFRGEIYKTIGQLEVDRLSLEVGIQYIDFTGTVSNLDQPLSVILSEFDPSGDIFSELLRSGISAEAASSIERWAMMQSSGCTPHSRA